MLCAPCGCLWSLLGVLACLLGRPCWGHTVDTPWSREQSLPLKGENLQMCMESQQHPFKHPTAAEQTWWVCGLVLSHAQVSLFVSLRHLTLLWIPKPLILTPLLSQSSLWAPFTAVNLWLLLLKGQAFFPYLHSANEVLHRGREEGRASYMAWAAPFLFLPLLSFPGFAFSVRFLLDAQVSLLSTQESPFLSPRTSLQMSGWVSIRDAPRTTSLPPTAL